MGLNFLFFIKLSARIALYSYLITNTHMNTSTLLRQVTASALIMGMLIATPATTPYLSRLLSVDTVSAATFSVTVEQTAGQVDPAPVGSPLLYTVTFATAIDVSTFTSLDLDFSSSTATGITVNSISEIAPNDGTSFSVSVTAATVGDVVMSVREGGNTSIYASVPYGQLAIARSTAGILYVVDTHYVSQITPDGVVTQIAPIGGSPGGGVDWEHQIVLDAAQNVYIME
jgi:hypothetical protein